MQGPLGWLANGVLRLGMPEATAKLLRRHGIALMLLLMVAVVVGSTYWERSYVGAMQDSCSSMYEDRLMPAALLFHLADQVHTRRLVLEEHLAGQSDYAVGQVYHELGRLDAGITGAIARIERTHLVEAESKLLNDLKAQLAEYARLERRALDELAAGKAVTYDATLRSAFSALRAELIGLTEIQEVVGKDLSKRSYTAAAGASSLTHLQLGACFVLGLFASALAMGLRSKRLDSQLGSHLH